MLWIVALALGASITGSANAAEPFRGFRSRIDAKRPPEVRNPLTPNWSYGARIELDMERTRDFDLDSREDDDTLVADPKFELALDYRSDGPFSAFVDLELGKEYLLEDPDGSTSRSTRLEITELWLELAAGNGRDRLRLGRQDFADERAWIYDEELDGARGSLSLGGAVVDLSITRFNAFTRDLLNSTEDERVNNYQGLLQFGEGDEGQLILYTLYRDAKESDGEDLWFTGLQAFGEVFPDADYWINIAGLDGDSEGNDIRALGIDAGFVYGLDIRFEPTFSIGLAYGSGDANPENRDRNFRQTGLQDNEAELGGVTDIKYYGHALDPELSNLVITTLGLSVHPSEDSAIELVYHHYRQDEAVDELRDSNLDVDPDGEHRTLGQALDLVLGYQLEDRFEFEFVAGWFFPGAAFEDNASAAFFAGLELIYEF